MIGFLSRSNAIEIAIQIKRYCSLYLERGPCAFRARLLHSQAVKGTLTRQSAGDELGFD